MISYNLMKGMQYPQLKLLMYTNKLSNIKKTFNDLIYILFSLRTFLPTCNKICKETEKQVSSFLCSN